MPQSSMLYIGMDVHTESIAVAYVAQDHSAEITELDPIGTRQPDLDHLVRTRQSQANLLVIVYEAGPCGSWLYRYLTKKGYACWVVALSLMPQKAGDRVNTNRRDAVPLARLMRSGDLTPVSVLEVEDEAMRDLGLTPSEYSSGERRRQEAITKAGTSHARRALIEGAWAYRYPANVSRHLQWQLEKVPQTLQDISWKAQVRPGVNETGNGAHAAHTRIRSRWLLPGT